MLKTALQYMNVFWNSPVDSAIQTATVDFLIGFFNQSLCIHESCFFLRECRESFQVHLVLSKSVSPVCFLEANPYINRNKRDLWTEKNQKQIQHRCDVRLSDYGPWWPRRHAIYSKPSHSLFVFDIEPLVKTFADSVGGISGREKTSQGLNLNFNYLN